MEGILGLAEQGIENPSDVRFAEVMSFMQNLGLGAYKEEFFKDFQALSLAKQLR
jgi:hypothetical protein